MIPTKEKMVIMEIIVSFLYVISIQVIIIITYI